MQSFVTWWCNLIGITDPTAIAIATGGAAASLLWLLGYLAIMAFIALFGWIVGSL